jgi:hypothetical protein
MKRMKSARSLLLNAVLLCACSPALDWRQMTPAELGLQASFPCRPAALAREVPVPQGHASMVMYACSTAGSTYAVSGLVVSDVRDVTSVIEFLRDAASRNVGADRAAARAFAVPGMTPNAMAGLFVLKGRRPDGSSVTEHLLLFAHGVRVYQASVVGDAPEEVAVATFFAGLKVNP